MVSISALCYVYDVNRIISIALILLMSLQCFYTLGVITYFQLNRDYIVEVLCVNKEKPITMCHGQCFLDRSLEVADAQSSDEGTAPVTKQNVDFPVFIISENQHTLNNLIVCDRHNVEYHSAVSSKHSSAPFHPPAAFC